MGAFKLGKMTFGSLFKKPETVLYPLETKPQPKGLKGHIVIDVERCIACGMCDRSCSTGCITVDRKERTWEIDPFACVQCGYCVVVCPKDCLVMDPNYHPASTARASVKLSIPEQEKAAPAAKEAPKPREGSSEQLDALVKKAQEEPASQDEQRANDAQLEALLAHMEAERAAKVRAALESTRSHER